MARFASCSGNTVRRSSRDSAIFYANDNRRDGWLRSRRVNVVGAQIAVASVRSAWSEGRPMALRRRR